ncbi:MAG: hypothetical protein WCO56_24185 [Verrucomicrobiota bacterium]
MSKPFYLLKYLSHSESYRLAIDYSLEEVVDPLKFLYDKISPEVFFKNFQFSYGSGSVFQDGIVNDIGWYIVSDRLTKTLQSVKNIEDVQFFPLPDTAYGVDNRLRGYNILAVKKRTPCLNKKLSDIRWSKTSPERHAIAIYKGYLTDYLIPNNCDIFYLDEYPVCPILSSEIAMKMKALKISGFDLEEYPVA